MRMPIRLLVASLFAAGACSAMAGSVNVTFVNTANFTDAGTTAFDEQANLRTLAVHLEKLGQRWLPAGQVLKIEVLDVDLAGSLRSQRDGSQLRVLRGGADWPRITLRYALEENGKLLRSGEEQVSDMTYAQGMTGHRDSTSLYYEKRTLDTWFRARFAEGRAAAG
jgi:hypothetical protein